MTGPQCQQCPGDRPCVNHLGEKWVTSLGSQLTPEQIPSSQMIETRVSPASVSHLLSSPTQCLCLTVHSLVGPQESDGYGTQSPGVNGILWPSACHLGPFCSQRTLVMSGDTCRCHDWRCSRHWVGGARDTAQSPHCPGRPPTEWPAPVSPVPRWLQGCRQGFFAQVAGLQGNRTCGYPASSPLGDPAHSHSQPARPVACCTRLSSVLCWFIYIPPCSIKNRSKCSEMGFNPTGK